MLPRAEHICEGRWGSIVPKPIILEEDRPIYPQIAEQLREEISYGIMKVGSDFPSDKQLTEIYEIARGTAQQVRSVLER